MTRADRQRERDEAAQFDAARLAVRAIASAFRTLRLYPLGHALTTEALETACRTLERYARRYGPLTAALASGGLTFGFRPQPYEDDVVADMVRALRARAVPSMRVLQDVSPAELGELLAVLHQPVQQLERAGGIGRYLAARGVRNLIIEDLPSAVAAEGDLLEPFLAAVMEGAADRIAAQLQQTGGREDTLRGLFRAFDRRILIWPRARQAAAWKAIGQTLAALRAPWQAAVCAMVVRSVDEPWAAALSAQWPPILAASLAAPAMDDAQAQGRRVADAVRTLHRQLPRTPLPHPPQASDQDVQRAAAELTSLTSPALREQALHRLLELLPAMDRGPLATCLDLVEREVVAVVAEADVPSLVAAVNGLSAAAGLLGDVRGELVRGALQRVITLGGRGLFRASGDSFVRSMQVAPGETVRVLLEVAGEEETIRARREAIDLLASLAAGRPDLLAPHVREPRWHIARNAVTVLDRIGGEAALPYLRAALAHADHRVRREAMRAMAGVGSAGAMEALAEVLLRADGDTQAAAAHWLGVMGRAEAAGVLIAVLERTPLPEQPEVKREAIRALGRLGGEDAVRALRRVAAAEGSLLRRRHVEELKQEAQAALARLHEGRT